MKCQKCGTENSATAITCVKCGTTLATSKKASEPAQQLRAPVRPPPVRVEPTLPKPAPGPQTPQPLSSPQPVSSPAPIPAKNTSPASPPVGASHAASPSQQQPSNPPSHSTTAFIPLPPAKEEVSFEPSEEELIKAYADPDWQIVSVIGLAQGGKSFFVNRLRQQLPLSMRNWVCPTPCKTKIERSSDGILWTDIHFVRSERINQRYLVADCAGESFENRSDDLTDRHRTKYYTAAIGLADAYIFVIPTEILLTDGIVGVPLENMSAELLRLRRDFGEIVRTILGAKARLAESGLGPVLRIRKKTVMEAARQRAKAFLTKGLTPDDLRAAFSDTIITRAPVFVAFTQADKLVNIANHDEDPSLFALQRINDLARLVIKHFHRYRFDFVSAFVGQTDPIFPDYDKHSWGATEVFEWVHDALRSRINSARLATRIRRRLDPEFRALLENAPGVR